MKATKVIITNRQSEIKLPSGLRMLVRRCCNAVLKYEGINEEAEVSVSFVDNKEIKELNGKFRNKPTETDVLSFPLRQEDGEFDVNHEDSRILLGDIVISAEKAMSQAEAYGHTLQREVAYLTVHSMLHLLGYDHEKGGLELVKMREKEESVLMGLGLPRSESYVFE